jgi:hypothetical protein
VSDYPSLLLEGRELSIETIRAVRDIVMTVKPMLVATPW